MTAVPHRYFIINKPCNVVSQFVSPDDVGLLGSINFDFPPGIHAIGRLDSHSEGLLILTTNKRVTRLLFESKIKHRRTYLVKVKDVVSPEALEKLRTGIVIKITGGELYTTPPCEVDIVDPPAQFGPGPGQWPAPHTWLSITLCEGKFHQVRKMVFAARHRCQRLVRTSIENLELGTLPPGGVKEFEESEFFRLLKIDDWQR